MNLPVVSRVAPVLTTPITIYQYRIPYTLAVVVTALVYWSVGKIGLQFAILHHNVSLVWAAAAFALVILIFGGLRLWVGITLGAFFVNLGTGVTFPAVMMIALGNTLGAVVGAYLLMRWRPKPITFEKVLDLLYFGISAPLIGAFISATIGTLALVLTGSIAGQAVSRIWLEWWMGDSIGILVLGPVLLLWGINPKLGSRNQRWLELIGVSCGAVVVSFIIFARDNSPLTDYPLIFLIFPVLIWAALRFSIRTNVTVCLVIALVSGIGIASQPESLSVDDLHRQFVYLWTFIAVTNLSAIALTAITTDRRRIEVELARERDYVVQVMNAMAHGVAVTDLDGRFEYVNPAYAQMLGYPQEALVGKLPGEVLSPDERAIVSNTAIRMTSDLRTVYETRFHRQDGTTLDVLVNGSMRRDQNHVTGIITAVTDLTLQKKTEAALQHSEARLRTIINNLPFDLWVQDVEGRCILQTPESIRLWGNVQGKKTEEIAVSLDVLQRWRDMNMQVFAGNTLRGNVVYDTNGQSHNYYYISSPIRDADLTHIGIMGINIDITEQVAAQRALQESEGHSKTFLERLKDLQDITIELTQIDDFDAFTRRAIELGRSRLKFERIGLWLIDADNPAYTVGTFGTHEDGSVRDERGVRAPSSQILPQLVNLFQINDQKLYYKPETELLNEYSESVGTGWSAMGYLSDGRQIIGGLAADNYFTREPVHSNQLELLALYANALGHICVLKRAQAKLQESEARFRSVFVGANVGIALADVQGHLISINPALEQLLGYSAEECSRMTFTEITYPDDQDDNLDQFTRLLKGEINFYQLEKRYIRKDGALVWVRLNVAPYPHEGEANTLAIIENIDARKQAEAELQHLTASLEQRVTDRTAELRTANERLTELDRLKTKFIADVTHELRTPLTVLKTRAYLLQHSPPEKHAGHLIALTEQLERLTNFVNATLDLSRLELGQDRIAFGPIDLNNVVQQVVGALHPRAEIAGLQMTFHAGSIPNVSGEFNQLAQVVTNLVANAINYTSNGSITVTTGFDATKGEVSLRVEDTGMGISEADIPHLFTRFYRGEKAGQSNIPGTGLGLSIVKEIVDLHRGRIAVESQIGKGTTFTVYLPTPKLE
ncbi:MAG: PAS domain S-box protein [Chloroflexi bacterium]|nr:PAS domain S-box protein [Chloroflexota bacterium]MCC6894660.1 PAS domain S-box protein [Anaerolineae bacterium]